MKKCPINDDTIKVQPTQHLAVAILYCTGEFFFLGDCLAALIPHCKLQVLHQTVEIGAKAGTRDAATLTSDLLPTLLEKACLISLCRGYSPEQLAADTPNNAFAKLLHISKSRHSFF